MSFSKKALVNYFTSEIRFNHHSIAFNKDSVYIHNKGYLYSYDIQLGEIAMFKPILFSPEEVSSSSLFISGSNLFLLGRFKSYEDCYIFKTSLNNLIPKWNSDKLISYEQLLNVKECSDMICSFNNGDKTKEVYLNKKIMFNFSLALKNLIVNWSQNSNVYIFNDINYISMYNTLKFIYSNFNENLNGIDYEIMNEMVYIILRYRAKSLLNIIIDHLQLRNDNAVAYYQIALKYNLNDFMKSTTKYISENLQNGLLMNENNDLKKTLYENFFCLHKVYVQANIIGIDIKNVSQMTLTSEKLSEIKDLNKEGKMNYCLICKRVFKNNINQ